MPSETSLYCALSLRLIVHNSARIQLIMFGRPHLSDFISETLEIDVPTIHVTSNNNSADIVHYIESSIQKSIMLKRVSTELRAEIVEKLSTGAQGMFIWVDLVLQELLKKKSTSAIRKSLNEAPKGLKEMLCHVLESFSLTLIDDEPDNLNELLAWTACAQQPLSLGELDTVVKLNSPDGEGMIYLEGALRKQFAAFFSLSRDDGLSTAELQTRLPSDYENDAEIQDSEPDEVLEDDDDVTIFDSNPATTQVTFCHGSVGDFLRDPSQGKVSANDEHPAIGVDYRSAKLSVFKTCLNLFCDDELQRKPQNCNQSLMPYAFNNWLHHFIAAEVPTRGDITQRKEIVGLLAKMFGREEFMTNWAGGIGWGFFNNDNVSRIRSWLDNEDDMTSLPSEDQDFIKATAESPALTFKPLAKYIAKKWLEDVYWLPGRCCEIVYGYMRLENGSPLDDNWVGLNAAEDIISVAEWTELPKTAVWHRRLGIALREHQNYDESLEHFAKALDLDNTMWLARAGIAMVYISKQEYGKAIELDKITERDIQQNLLDERENTLLVKANLHKTLERIAECYEALKDEENCFIYYQNAQRYDRNCNSCTCLILSKMHEKELCDDMIDLLRAMDAEQVYGQNFSCLTNSLWQNQNESADYFISVATAAQKTENVDYLIEVYRNAIQTAKKHLKMVVASGLELCIARLYSQYTREQKKAVRIWNNIVETFPGSREESDMGEIKQSASTHLARYFFQRAFDLGYDSPDTDKYVRRMEKLAKTRPRSVDDSQTFVSASPPALILGLWYRLNGMNNEANNCFRPSIQEAIQILSDDDPDNDLQGFYQLVFALLAAGDDENVIAIAHYCGAYEQEQNPVDSIETPTSETDEAATDINESDNANNGTIISIDPGSIKCDGSCNRIFYQYDNFSVCRYCYNIGFCENCLALVKSGTLPLNLCSKDHEWLVIPPKPRGMPSSGSNILVGGVLSNIEEWKSGLKKRWQV